MTTYCINEHGEVVKTSPFGGNDWPIVAAENKTEATKLLLLGLRHLQETPVLILEGQAWQIVYPVFPEKWASETGKVTRFAENGTMKGLCGSTFPNRGLALQDRTRQAYKDG